MRAMTPSPMRTMAANCFARVGFVMNILGKRGFGGVPLYVRFVGGTDGKQVPLRARNGGQKGKGKNQYRRPLRFALDDGDDPWMTAITQG
jgi:hypothetical protein